MLAGAPAAFAAAGSAESLVPTTTATVDCTQRRKKAARSDSDYQRGWEAGYNNGYEFGYTRTYDQKCKPAPR